MYHLDLDPAEMVTVQLALENELRHIETYRRECDKLGIDTEYERWNRRVLEVKHTLAVIQNAAQGVRV